LAETGAPLKEVFVRFSMEMSHGTESTEWIIGYRVKIKTSLGEEIEGKIFSYDTITNCVVLQDSLPGTQKSHFRIIKASFIKEVQALSVQSSPADVIDLPPVNINKIRAREEVNTSLARQRLGVGVSSEAQEIFNALSKTLPCRWENNEIVVFDDIRITSPYQKENVSGGTAASIARIQKVLEGEKTRINNLRVSGSNK